MRRIAFAAAVAVAAIATPAHANETRVEARGGIVWDGTFSDDTLGIAVGHDFDLNEQVFFGIEGVADSNISFDDPVLGVNARLGTTVKENTKIFVLGGYAHSTDIDEDDFIVGAGFQHNFGERSLLSVQYQRAIDLELNRVIIGFGVRF
jgi:opacity protein-like surface antigen